MQQDQTIRIDINLSDSEIRNLNSIIQDLTNTVNDLRSSFQTAQQGLETLGGGFDLLKMVTGSLDAALSSQRTNMGHLRDAAFMLHDDGYERLIFKVVELTGKQSIAIGATKGLSASFALKGTKAKLAAGGVAVLTGALKLLPFIGIASAVWTFGSSLIGLLVDMYDTSDATENLGEETETLRTRIDNLSEAIQRNRRAHQENLDEIRTHERLTGSMIDRIRELNNEQRFTVENQRLLKIWVDQFNDAMGENILTIDRYTGRLDANSQSMIDNRIFNRELALETEKFEEKSRALNDALTDQNNIIYLMEYGELATELRDAEEAVNYYREELELATEAMEASASSNLLMEAALSSANRGYREAQEELDILREKKYELNEEYEESVERIAKLEAQMQESYINMRNLVADYVDEHGIQYWMLNNTQREVVNEMLGRWETYRDMGSEMFRKLAYDSEVYLGDILANQEHNLQATEDWQNNLALLSARYGEEVAQHFREMGESGMTTVAAMAADVITSYGEMETWTSETLELMANESGSRATQIVENLDAAGELAGRGVAMGLEEGAEDVIRIVEELGNQAPTTLQERFDAADFGSIGARVVEVTVEGLLREGPTAERAAIKSGNYVLRGFEDAFEQGEEQMLQSGRNMLLGFNTGVTEIIPDSCTLAKKAAMAIYEELRGFNEENSPSRLYMRSGRNMILGLIEGIENLQERPVNRIQTIARNMQRVYNSSDREYTNIGRQIMTGLNQGLLNGEGQVMSTANRIAQNIARTMQQALQINSPSRLMREQIGRQIPAGIGAGIDKYADVAIDSVYKLGHDLVKLNLPSVESMIGLGPSMRLAGAGGTGSFSTTDNSVTNNFEGLFEGATINWHNKEDIRTTMQEMAWIAEREKDRMW